MKNKPEITPQHPWHLYAMALLFMGLTVVMLVMINKRNSGWDAFIASGAGLMAVAFVCLWLCFWRISVLRKQLAEHGIEV